MTEQERWEAKMRRVRIEELHRGVQQILEAAGTRTEAAKAVANALCAASIKGVDSHGVRLTPHYEKVVQGGRIHGQAQLSVREATPVALEINANNSFGHYAAYRAIEEGVQRAEQYGIAWISVIHSSHLGALGSYVEEAARQGFLALGATNTDSFVLPYGGRTPFHGTNPIAFAAPTDQDEPFLLDMATSCVPWNRVADYASQGRPLPNDVAVDSAGNPTNDPKQAAALRPFGGADYGFKGAGLGALVEVLCSPLTGMPFCTQILPMVSEDNQTPRHMGQSFVVFKPDVFVQRTQYLQILAEYLDALRSQPAQQDQEVLAPGDREWRTKQQRSEQGVPVPDYLIAEFSRLTAKYGLPDLKFS